MKATTRKSDTVCVKCGAPIFWAVAGWWLHMYWGVTCFSPTPKLVSLEKTNANNLPVLPGRNHIRAVSLKEPGVELVSCKNTAFHMLGRTALVHWEGVADSGTV